ncbi:MAG: GDP-mannose 4,6-dehydratase [Planctomycetota bacterium]
MPRNDATASPNDASEPRRALITGITGQDGSYLAEFLLAKGYEVHGIVRRASLFNTGRIDHIYQDPHEPNRKLVLHHGDVTDAARLHVLVNRVRPHEVYNLAAQSHVRVSFDLPVDTCEITAIGTVKLLEAVRDFERAAGRSVRVFQASSSEMFGNAPEVPQRETTPFAPRSPYAYAKVFSHHAFVNDRESYGTHRSCGSMFNHESPRRGETFVTRKITRAVGRIAVGLQDKLFLGNLDAKRDWGFAGDYVEAMWLMLQQDEPGDYVIATGTSISVRDFAALAFEAAGLEMSGRVEFDERYLRPAEVDTLCGDASRLKNTLNWSPKTSIKELARMMVAHDLELAQRERTLRDAGYAMPEHTGHDR